MKSVLIVGLFAALGVAQITRDNNGLSSTSDDSDSTSTRPSVTTDNGKTTLQWPAYSAAYTTTTSSVDTAFQTWLAVESTSASSTSTVYPVSSAPTTLATTYASSSRAASTGVPVYNATSGISIHNSFSSSSYAFGSTTAKASTTSAKISTTSTKTASTVSAATSAFTGVAVLGKEIAYGLGAAAAGFAMMV